MKTKLALLAVLLGPSLAAQTLLNSAPVYSVLNLDVTAGTTSKPYRPVATLPGTCAQYETVVLTTTWAVYVCDGSNAWHQLGSTSFSLAGGALGSLPYQSAPGVTALLSGNPAATDLVLISHGTGSGAAMPFLANAPALSAANMNNFPILNQSTTGTAAGVSGTFAANQFYATPNGVPGSFSPRALVASDISGLSYQTPLTFSGGLVNNSGTVTSLLLTGASGGQTVIGGLGVTDVLTLQGTAGNGTAGVAGIIAKVGNNGATTALTILNNGNVGLGTCAAPTVQICYATTAATESAGIGAELTNASDTLTGTGTDWTGTYAGGLVHAATGTTALVDTTLAIVTANYYQVTVVVTSWTAGSVTATIGTAVSPAFGANGTFIFSPRAGSTGSLTFTPTAAFAGTITFSVKLLTTYAAAQNILDHNGAVGMEIRSNLNASANTWIGRLSGQYNTTGTQNTAIGSNALLSNTSGSSNTALGINSLFFNTSGLQNLAIGSFTLVTNTSGQGNVAIGYNALNTSTTASFNVGIGSSALFGATTGAQNVSIGLNSLFGLTTGTLNVAIGTTAGRFIADGATANTGPSNGIYIGQLSKAKAATDQQEIVIGSSTIGQGSNTATIGATTQTDFYIYGKLHFLTVYSAAGTALPACSASFTDTIAAVSDATTPTYRGAYTSGGAVRTLVYCDGTSWTTH